MEYLQRKNFWSTKPNCLLHLLALTHTEEQTWTRFWQLILTCTGPCKAETGEISHSGHTGTESGASSPSDFVPMKEIRTCILYSPPCRRNTFTLPYHVVSVLPELQTARHTLTAGSFSNCISSWKVLVSKQSYIYFECALFCFYRTFFS